MKAQLAGLTILAAIALPGYTNELALVDAEPSAAVMVIDETLLQQRVAELMGVVGLADQARHVSQAVLNAEQATLGQQYQLVNQVSANWAPQRLQQSWLAATPALSEQQRLDILQRLQSAGWQQARQRELAAIHEQGSPAYLDYVQRLRLQTPPAARLALIDELNEVMHFEQLMVRTRTDVYQQLQQVLPDWQPPQQWQLNVRQQVREFLLYTHRRTPNEQLQALVALYRQPQLQQWMTGFVNRLPAVNG